MTEDYKSHGWMISYQNGTKICIGWIDGDNGWNGNRITLRQSDFQVEQEKTGWYENGEKVGELRDDMEKLIFKISDIFQ